MKPLRRQARDGADVHSWRAKGNGPKDRRIRQIRPLQERFKSRASVSSKLAYRTFVITHWLIRIYAETLPKEPLHTAWGRPSCCNNLTGCMCPSTGGDDMLTSSLAHANSIPSQHFTYLTAISTVSIVTSLDWKVRNQEPPAIQHLSVLYSTTVQTHLLWHPKVRAGRPSFPQELSVIRSCTSFLLRSRVLGLLASSRPEHSQCACELRSPIHLFCQPLR